MRVILTDGSGDDHQSDAPDPFTQGSADRAKDRKYVERLDMNTKMLRRVYEMLIFLGNPRLKILDGLTVDRSVTQLEDEVWEALLANGVLVRPDPNEAQHEEAFSEPGATGNMGHGAGEQEEALSEPINAGNPDRGAGQQEEVVSESIASKNPVEEPRWPREDSFA
jgi:hypothetical protein